MTRICKFWDYTNGGETMVGTIAFDGHDLVLYPTPGYELCMTRVLLHTIEELGPELLKKMKVESKATRMKREGKRLRERYPRLSAVEDKREWFEHLPYDFHGTYFSA